MWRSAEEDGVDEYERLAASGFRFYLTGSVASLVLFGGFFTWWGIGEHAWWGYVAAIVTVLLSGLTIYMLVWAWRNHPRKKAS